MALYQPERPLKDVISLKFKIFNLMGSLSIHMLFYVLIMLFLKSDSSFLGISALCLFVLSFALDNRTWDIFTHRLGKKLKFAIMAVNVLLYLVLAVMLRNNLTALIMLTLDATILNLLGFRSELFLWKTELIAVFSAIVFVFFSTGKISGNLVALLLPIMQFILIYLYKMVKHSEQMINKEIEKRQTVFLNNQISQLEVKQKAAFYDPMTHILNRRGFEVEVVPIFKDCYQNLTPFALLALDIDHFKNINDTYGHDKGDVALKTFVEAVNSTIRPATDAIARVGGEEFVITTIGVDSEEKLMAFAERVRKVVEDASWDGNKKFTVSIGAVLFPYSQDDNVEKLMKKADVALYHSKDNGRNQVTVYHEED